MGSSVELLMIERGYDMGTRIRLVGIVPPDDKWKKMKAIFDACIKGDIEIPDEVDEFFDNEDPDPAGVIIDLTPGQYTDVARPWGDMDSDGIEITVDDIPKNVKILRFYNGN